MGISSSTVKVKNPSRKGPNRDDSIISLKKNNVVNIQQPSQISDDQLDFGDEYKFSKESVDYTNNFIDDQDPRDLAMKFFKII